MRTIRVTGKGQIRVHPDMTKIMITLKDRYNSITITNDKYGHTQSWQHLSRMPKARPKVACP